VICGGQFVIAIGKDKSISSKDKQRKNHSLKSNISDERPKRLKSKENITPEYNKTLDNISRKEAKANDRGIEVFKSGDNKTNSANISFTKCNEHTVQSSPR
jgi:hypothetical protein